MRLQTRSGCSEEINEDPERLIEHACALGLEGIIGKHRDRPTDRARLATGSRSSASSEKALPSSATNCPQLCQMALEACFSGLSKEVSMSKSEASEPALNISKRERCESSSTS